MCKVLAALILALTASAAAHAAATDFWSQTRRGTNSFNHTETVAHLVGAKEFGAGFVRVAIDKWHSESRDFLAGDMDHYDGLVAADAAKLRAILDGAAAHGVPILVTALGVPGDRWVQHNGDMQDTRIWHDKTWWAAAARYWGDIARTFKGHKAIAGYDVLNEPVPEWNAGLDDSNDSQVHRDAWCARIKGTARDLYGLYRAIVAAIRAQDPDVPIVLESGLWSKPMAVRCMEPIVDPHVIYSIHMYEPYAYTTFRENQGKWRYPGRAPYGGRMYDWDAAALANWFRPMLDWADAHGIKHDRLLLGEFGCDRRVEGCAAYLHDVIAAAESARMHWAFYAFREDGWDAMDYEIGSGPTPAGYWDAVVRSEAPNPPHIPNPMAQTLRDALSGPIP